MRLLSIDYSSMKRVLLFYLFTFLLSVSHSQTPTTSGKSFSIGVVEEIQSAELKEKRILNIYLPEGYNPADTTRYSIVYLLDGSADEDFIHVAGLYQFNGFSWINRTPNTIVVGIANVDRKRDFTYPTTIAEDKQRFPTTGGSANFISFLEKELQPFIEKKFRTNGSKTLIGQSLGGLLAAEVLLKKPTLFTNYIIISPSLWWDDGSLLKQESALLKKEFTQPTGIYIGVGKEGLAPCKIPHVMEVDANLLAEKIRSAKSKQVTVYFDYLPLEDHATITHQAVFNAIRFLNPVVR